MDELIDMIDKLKLVEPPDFDLKSLAELEMELEHLTDSVRSLRDEETAVQKQIREQTKINESLRKQLKSVKTYRKSLQWDLEKLKTINDALTEEPLTEKDLCLMEECRRKFKLYEELTGVVIDFSSVGGATGFIAVNKKNGFMHKFPDTEDTEAMWKEVAKASSSICSKHSFNTKSS